MNVKSILMLNIGIIGFAALLALNLLAYFSLHQSAAELFESSWWSTWAPSYLIWLVFIAVGLSGFFQLREVD